MDEIQTDHIVTADMVRCYARVSLVYQFASGKLVSAMPTPLQDGFRAAEANLAFGRPRQGKASVLDEPAFTVEASDQTVDINGDGVPEVLLTMKRAAFGEETSADATRTEVWSLVDGVVGPFAPARELLVTSFTDWDKDGTADVETAAPYNDAVRTDQGSLGCGARPFHLTLLLHGLKEGGTSADDAVAVEYARGQCGGAQLLPLKAVQTAEDGYRWAACQRMNGTSEEALLSLLDRRCPRARRTSPAEGPGSCGGEDLCDDPDLFKRAASLSPPLRLSR